MQLLGSQNDMATFRLASVFGAFAPDAPAFQPSASSGALTSPDTYVSLNAPSPRAFQRCEIQLPSYLLPLRPLRCQIRLFRSLSPGRFVSVGLSGLEPLTPALSAQCSNQLSYRPFYLSHAPTHNFCATRIATFTSTLLSLRVPDFSGGSHPQGLHPAVRIPASNAHSSLSPK